MSSSDVEAFMAYIRERGVPDEYHGTYRVDANSILREEGASSLGGLSNETLHEAVRRVEQALRNRKAVVAAVDAYRRALREGWKPQAGGAGSDDGIPESIRNMGSSAVASDRPGEHRRYTRVPFNGEVRVSGGMGGCRASDISIGGLYLESRRSWEEGEILELEFRLHSKEPPLRVRGRVVFVDFGVGAGVDFVGTPRPVRHSIRRFVEAAVARER